jgi:hypothetical protein
MNLILYQRIFALCLWASVVSNTQAQDLIRQQPCDTQPYQAQIDSIKQLFQSRGFIVLHEASMTMVSQYEMPIVVPMSQGAEYEFVFIGDPSSKLYEVRMYDWDERQVVYQKKHWGDVEGNIISYAYVPQASEYHMIKPVQVNNRKKNLCGYVLLLKRVILNCSSNAPAVRSR